MIESAKSVARNTVLFFGVLADGRFVVSSRFQWEVRTKDRSKAESVFRSLVGGA